MSYCIMLTVFSRKPQLLKFIFSKNPSTKKRDGNSRTQLLFIDTMVSVFKRGESYLLLLQHYTALSKDYKINL